ncbi:MAG: two-component system, NarL family, sensor histidine kinase EvgS [Paraburkholderia sp.]|nr:two-component system, NarL family, sensor histidine kinase EvgS [Paraburkholderia sp.]
MRRILSGPALGRRIMRLVGSRAIATAGASLLALVALAGCPGSTQTRQAAPVGSDLRLSLSPAERSYLESLPVLRLGTDPQWAPISYVDEHSRLEGISADYLSFIRDSLGVRLRIVPTHSWGETIQLANSGGLDVVVAASRADGLAPGFVYSKPYVRYPVVIVTRETAPFIGGPRDISGAEVALVKDSEVIRAELPGLRNMRTVTVATAEEGLQAVANSHAFAYIGNLGVVDRLVREKYAGILRVAAPTGHVEDLSFGIAPRFAPLVPLIDRVLASIPESEREHIQNSWLSTHFTFGIPVRTLWIVLTPVVVLTAIFLAVLCGYMLRLRKEVRQRRWTERQLVFETQFKTLLMNTIPIPVFVKDAEGKYLGLNPAYEDALGVRADALIGKKMPTNGAVHPDDAREINAITERVLATGSPAQGELPYHAPDGTMHVAVYWVRLCKADDEMPRAVVGAFVDVSDLRRMERREIDLKRQLVELTQALPAVVFQLRFVRSRRPRFELIFVNQRAHDLLRLHQSAAGDTLGTFLRCLDARHRFHVTRLFLRSARLLDPVRVEFELALGGARSTWVNLEAAPQTREDGEVVWSGYVRDVSEAKQIQGALLAAKQDAEEATRARDTFLATVSHEIRTPMSGVVGILQLLDHGRLSPDDQHLLDMARSATELLLRILNDILDFAKSENGDLTLECAPMSVTGLVERVTGIVAPEIERKGLHLDVDVSREVAPRHVGDVQRLGQVLLNLLGNASKFTDYGAVSLSVSVLATSEDAQRLQISVADTGIGIAREDQAGLFSPFAQARHSSGARYAGTGLGLAICKRLIESMGGSIVLHSELGRGTTVSMELSLPVDRNAMPRRSADDAAPRAGDENAAGHQAASRRILLVEDQVINREVLKRQLANLRITECDVAANGAEALKALERQYYAMVITDCAMPVMGGVELMRHIRQRERGTGRRTALVALTANAMQQQRDECFVAGADDVFVKPIEQEQLCVLLERHGITAPPITQLDKAGISVERHTDLWEKLQRTLAAEMTALLSLSLDDEGERAKDIVHRIVGAASWFQLGDVAQAAMRLDQCLRNGQAPHADLFALRTAIARATGEPLDASPVRAS